MMKLFLLTLLGPLSVAAQQRATFTQYGAGDALGSPNCASTFNACGQPSGGFTAALSQRQFGVGPGGGAGPACGSCYQLTIDTDLNGNPTAQNTITVRVDNLCPIDGNPICDVTNQYGGEIHFDLCIDSGAPAAFFSSSTSGIGSAVPVAC